MKHKKRTQPTFSTKTFTCHPININTKTDQNQANKKRTKFKFSKKSYIPINPVPDWHNPKNQNEPKTEKHPFLVRF